MGVVGWGLASLEPRHGVRVGSSVFQALEVTGRVVVRLVFEADV